MLTNLPHSHLLPKNIKHLQGSECQLYIMIEVNETFSWRLQQTQNMDRTTDSLFYKAPTWPSHRGSPDSTNSLPRPLVRRVNRESAYKLQPNPKPRFLFLLSSFSSPCLPTRKHPNPGKKNQYRSQAGRSSPPPSTHPLPAVSSPSEGTPGSRTKPRASL